jgi:gas vesicle protein
MSDNTNRSILPGLAVAFVGGALVGVTVALLYAPHSGKETRALLSRKAHDLKEAAADAVGQGRTLVSSVRQKVGAAIRGGDRGIHETMGDGAAEA